MPELKEDAGIHCVSVLEKTGWIQIVVWLTNDDRSWNVIFFMHKYELKHLHLVIWQISKVTYKGGRKQTDIWYQAKETNFKVKCFKKLFKFHKI